MCAGTGDGVSSGVSWSEWNRAESRMAVADPSSTRACAASSVNACGVVC